MQSWPTPKDPNDIVRRGFDWSKWLVNGRTSITTSEFINDGSITIDQKQIDGGITSFRVQGGTAGMPEQITNRVTFNNGDQIDRTRQLNIREN